MQGAVAGTGGGFLRSSAVMQNPYAALTTEFNSGGLRVLLSSGQAVVAHGLAVTSKDGDWILRERDEDTQAVLHVLARHGARYRFGAPLDSRWLAGGWSSHFEFAAAGLRIRTDFVTRPPRLSPAELAAMWSEAERSACAVVGIVPLAMLKLTNRERDYAIIGELARRMDDPRDQLRHSRSARDLIQLANRYPEAWCEVQLQRPLLAEIGAGRDALEAALDRERRRLMRANEERLLGYQEAGRRWAAIWPDVQRETAGLALPDAHAVIARRAEGVLPFTVTAACDDHGTR